MMPGMMAPPGLDTTNAQGAQQFMPMMPMMYPGMNPAQFQAKPEEK